MLSIALYVSIAGMFWKKIVKIRNGFEIELRYLMEYNKVEYNKIMTGTTAAQAASWFRGEMFEEEKNMMTRDWNARSTKACVRPVSALFVPSHDIHCFHGNYGICSCRKNRHGKIIIHMRSCPKSR